MKMLSGISSARFMVSLSMLLVTTAAISPAASAGADHTETVVREIDLEGARSVLLEAINGKVEISGDESRKSIYLKVVKIISEENEEDAAKLASMMEIEVTRADSAIKISMSYPKDYKVKKNIFSFLMDRRSRIRTDITLVLPRGIGCGLSLTTGEAGIYDLNADVTSTITTGKLDIRNIKGKVVVSQTTGDLDISEITGDARVAMTTGSLSCRNFSGGAEVDMLTGSLDLASISGNVDLKVGFGKVDVEDVGGVVFSGKSADAKFIGVRGPIDASSASGNISFRTSPEKDVDYKVTSSSGSISLRFMRKMPGGFYLVASTTSGNIDAVLPIDITKVARTHIVGRVRKGKAKVFLETASGDITIQEPEE